jgi:hypothetical protein
MKPVAGQGKESEIGRCGGRGLRGAQFIDSVEKKETHGGGRVAVTRLDELDDLAAVAVQAQIKVIIRHPLQPLIQ